jgi:hypothetical protein
LARTVTAGTARELTSISAANVFLRQQYISEFNQRLMVKAAERGTAFVPLKRKRSGAGFLLTSRARLQ